MSNPYAPPERRPGTSDDAPAQQEPVWPPAGAVPPVPVVQERPPADPEGTVRATRLTRLFAVLILASVLVDSLRLPWNAAALPFALAATVVGARAIMVAVRARSRGLVPLLTAGLVIGLFLTFFLTVQLAVWPASLKKQDCLEGALTIGARNACEREFRHDLDELRAPLQERSTES